MKKKFIYSGLMLLIIIFVATCLFTFASIILVSSKQTAVQANIITTRQTDYYDACNRAYKTIADTLKINDSYDKTFFINDEENLCISYTVSDNTYQITKWQVINITDWHPDDKLNLIQ